MVGTSGGVARFDGLAFEPVVLDSLDSAIGLTREWINAVATTPEGTLWIATPDAGLFVQAEGRSALSSDPSRRGISSLLVSGGGALAGIGPGFGGSASTA